MEQPRTGDRRKNSITLDKKVVKYSLAAVTIVLIIGLSVSIGALIISFQVKSSNQEIKVSNAKVSAATKALKKANARTLRNTLAIRDSGYSTCQLNNGIRAQLQFTAGLTPKAAIKNILKILGLPKELAEQTSLSALRKRLPIYDCFPLIQNRPARALPPAKQIKFVKWFVEGSIEIPPPRSAP